MTGVNVDNFVETGDFFCEHCRNQEKKGVFHIFTKRSKKSEKTRLVNG